ncbi:MAG: aldo/keto reductase [Sandaracinaceae bacterium]
MQSRSLGLTDIRVSEIALGTWGLTSGAYGEVKREKFDRTMARALERGVTTFDVAPTWGEDGASETWLKEALEDCEIEPVIISRGGARFVDGKLACSFTVDDLVKDCEASLERLGRETIDVWLLHNPSHEVLTQDDWREAIHKLEAEGKIRAFGVSVGEVDDARIAVEHGAQVVCLTHNLLNGVRLDELTEELTANGAGVLARSPLMFGLLAGRWSADRVFDEDDHRARRWNKDTFKERIRQVDALRFLVGSKHEDLATAALRFTLTHAQVSCALVGARTAAQIEAAVEAASGPPYLTDEDMTRLAKVRNTAGI